MPKTISFRLGSKSTSGFAEFSEYLIASRSAERLLENLSMDFIISSGLRGMTERKIKEIKVSFEPEHEIKQTREQFTMCCKRIIALKHRHIFLWAIT